MNTYTDISCPLKSCASRGSLENMKKHWVLYHTRTRTRSCNLCDCAAFSASHTGLFNEIRDHLFECHQNLVHGGVTRENILTYSVEGPMRNNELSSDFQSKRLFKIVFGILLLNWTVMGSAVNRKI